MHPLFEYLKRRHQENIENNKKAIYTGHWGLSGMYIRKKNTFVIE